MWQRRRTNRSLAVAGLSAAIVFLILSARAGAPGPVAAPTLPDLETPGAPVPVFTGEACCLPGGICLDLLPPDCNVLGGKPQGPGTQCLGDNDGDGNDDACDTQACCLPGGICLDLSPGDCNTLGGELQGPFTFCLGDGDGDGNDDACDTQACCLPGGICLDLSPGDCALLGGKLQGLFTFCLGDGDGDGNDDACDTQACCLPGGICLDLSPGDCAVLGGKQQGPFTFCLGDGDGDGNDDACNPEACCLTGGACLDLTPADCNTLQGKLQGPGTACQGDTDGNGIDDACEREDGGLIICLWDCGDGDGEVGIVDFLELLSQWGQDGSCDFDDGGVGITDFLKLLANWGDCPVDCDDASRCQFSDLTNAFQSNGVEFTAADNFVPGDTATAVSAACWRGVYFDFADCGPGPDDFRVRYYLDDAGLPGALLAEFSQSGGTLTVSAPVATGDIVAGIATEFEHTASHDPVAVVPGECYWIEVVNLAPVVPCIWFWSLSMDGDLYAVDDIGTGGYDVGDIFLTDYSFCLNVPLGGAPPCPQALAPSPPDEHGTVGLLGHTAQE